MDENHNTRPVGYGDCMGGCGSSTDVGKLCCPMCGKHVED